MSGKDERRSYGIPPCPKCGRNTIVVLKDFDHRIIGWLLPKDGAKKYSASIVLSDGFHQTTTPKWISCSHCGHLGYEASVSSIQRFRRKYKEGDYIAWKDFKIKRDKY